MAGDVPHLKEEFLSRALFNFNLTLMSVRPVDVLRLCVTTETVHDVVSQNHKQEGRCLMMTCKCSEFSQTTTTTANFPIFNFNGSTFQRLGWVQ